MSDVRTNGQHDTRDVYVIPPRESVLQDGEQLAAVLIVALVVLLGLLGFVNSFTRVADAVRPYFGDMAPSVPLGVDVGIFAFTGLDLLMARMDMRTRWLRLIPWALVGATVYLNVADETELIGKVAHGVLPMLWVVAVEAGAHMVRVKAGLSGHGTDRMDRVRLSRWLLSPGTTALLWRRMILWEIRSYPSALERERDRLLALCALQDRYGWFRWRWRAPRQQRALQRLGELTPTGVVKEIAAPTTGPVEVPASPPAKPPRPKAIAPSTEDPETVMRRLVRDEFNGTVPGRPTWRPHLKRAGVSISNDDLAALIQKLRAEETSDAG